jgi:ubiquitin C-terminal hydrolase
VGSIGGGHYTACAKVAGEGGGEGGKWVSFDDRWVEEMEGGREGGREGGGVRDRVVTPAAYLLFFERRGWRTTEGGREGGEEEGGKEGRGKGKGHV